MAIGDARPFTLRKFKCRGRCPLERRMHVASRGVPDEGSIFRNLSGVQTESRDRPFFKSLYFHSKKVATMGYSKEMSNPLNVFRLNWS